MPKTDEVTTACVEAIASQIVDLEETEVLVLRLPVGMATAGQPFEQFRKELRRLLPESIEEPVRAIVLRSDMELESFDAEQLARVSLSTRKAPPYKPPEELFESGPLRSAAKAAWASAFGDQDTADAEVHNAEEALRVEIETKGKLKIEHGSSSPKRGPF